MKYTHEDIYLKVGKEDKVATITFQNGSESFNKYGDMITGVILYTQKEREELDILSKSESFGKSGPIKIRSLDTGLNSDQELQLKIEGINSEDIINIFCFPGSEKNTFHSKEKRHIEKGIIPMKIAPKGRDYDWIYGFKKRQIASGIELCPRERKFYLAIKFYYEPDKLTDSEKTEIFPDGEIMLKEIEYELLELKYQREEISDSEVERLLVLYKKKLEESTKILDKYLSQAGSSLKKLFSKNQEKALDIYFKVINFKERRLNVMGKKPIYIDIDSYLHIYMRHVKEMKVNEQFEHKDNFQWNEEDVFLVMENVIREFNDDIQKFFLENKGKRYSRYGSHSAYYQGDYYTFHVELDGRISTFHKNKKQHENQN